MYSCRVFHFLFWLLIRNLGHGQSPVYYCIYLDTISLGREQFFRLTQTSIQNTRLSPLESSSQYMLAFRTLLKIVIIAILILRILLLRF